MIDLLYIYSQSFFCAIEDIRNTQKVAINGKSRIKNDLKHFMNLKSSIIMFFFSRVV